MPTPRHVLGFRLGSREATNQEIGRYWHAVDRASDRVVTGVYAHSWEGRPLRYALVGNPSNLHRLPAIRRDLDRLRKPSTPDGGSEGDHPSYPHDPVDRVPTSTATSRPAATPWSSCCTSSPIARDCVARAILGHSIVGLIPVQNPDGRAHDTRYNGYSFDMNRDGLVGTQPEVSGRLKLLWKYPPQLFVDEHENSGHSYFFPPDADPIYHETPNKLYRQVEDLYGPANERPSRRTTGATRPGSPGTTSSPRCTATPSRPPRWARWG